MDGLTTQVMSTLTGSVFLVAFALSLGASDLVIGLLATIPPLSNVIQIPTIYLVEKLQVRRSITLVAAALSRSFLLLIAFIPFLFPFSTALPLVLVALVMNSLLASVGGCSWNSWMYDLVPKQSLGWIFSKKMLLATALGIPLALAAGYFITWWKAAFPGMEIGGYSVLFAAGCVAGLLGVLVISGIPEPKMERHGTMPRFRELLRKPFQDRNFKNLIVFMASWNFAINLAVPFTTVYMLATIGLDTSTVVLFSVISQVSSLAFFRIWGKLSDRFSNTSVLRVSGPIMIATILMWASTILFQGTPVVVPLIIVINVLTGMATAGVNLVSGNIGLKLAPKGESTAYLASSSFFSSLAAGIAPLLGGIVAMYAPEWEYFFLVAFVLGLYSLHRLTKVKEDGDVQEKVVVKELCHEMRNGVSLSRVKEQARSATLGLSAMVHVRRRRRRERGLLAANILFLKR